MNEQTPPTSPARAAIARWLLGGLLSVGALALLAKPGGASKLLGIAIAALAVMAFTRKDKSSATIIAIALMLLAAFYALVLVTGHSQWLFDRYN